VFSSLGKLLWVEGEHARETTLKEVVSKLSGEGSAYKANGSKLAMLLVKPTKKPKKRVEEFWSRF